VGKPRLVLADEPTGNLDSQTSLDVMRILSELRKEGMTILLVTHEADIAGWAHRVITMRDGTIRSDDRRPPTVQEARS
jgi:putative ABC transport system ATP-binding protein